MTDHDVKSTNEYEQKLLQNIEEHGWQSTHVFDDEGEPCFTYSIGIYKCTNQPELIITGLKRELAHWIIGEYNRRLNDGEQFKAGEFYDDFLEGFQVTFKEFDESNYEEYLGSCLWLYGGPDFKAYQLIWPSTKGVWPWDNDASEGYLQMIPKLYKD